MTLGLDDSDYQKTSQRVKKENQSFTEEQKKQLDKVEKQAKQALSAISNVQKGIIGMFAAVAGATGVTQFLTQVNQAEAALGRLSSHTGQSTEELHKWSNMAAIVGGSAEDMQAGVSNLQQQLTDLKYKGEMGSTVTFLAQMGVAVADTNGEMRKQSDIMLDLSDRAKNMKKEDFYNLASSSGMTDSQIELIMKGRTELEKMMIAQEENALVTKKQAEEARKLQAEWEMMKQSIFSAGVRILHDLMPIIQLIAEGLRELFNFLQKHRGIIYGFFIGLAAAMLPVLISTTLLVAQFLMLAAPIIAVSLAIGLLIDDFLTWQEGGESLFGTFYDWFDKLIDKVTGFGDLLKAIFTGDWAKVSEIIARSIQTVVNDAPKPIKDAHQAAVDWTSDKIEKAANFFSGDKPKEATPSNSNSLAKFAQEAELPAIKAWVDQKLETAKDIVKDATSVVVGTTQMASEVQQGMQSNIDGDYVSHPPIKSNAKGDKQIAFIKKYWGAAVKIASALDTKPEFILAQFAGETDWGKKVINGTGYNLGNIKAGSSWKGGTVKAYDPIEKSYDPYRVYSSSEEFAADYIKLISKKKIYKNVAGSQTAQKFYSELKSAGYATDVDYVSKNLKMVDSVTMRMDMSKLKKNSKPVPTTNQAQAAISNTTSTGNNTNIETHIGEVKVFTAATDANGIAKDISNVLAFNMNTYAFDSGMS
ncbi:mannosyl-glycoendo-beta-N-acetylglucosaminidase family protein [Acinetobacter baumannii 1437282]|nr:mannosyl-glycoendo-beta-N-acetylglucosaminidase family protein [Acinetobacter baumannii 1437282]